MEGGPTADRQMARQRPSGLPLTTRLNVYMGSAAPSTDLSPQGDGTKRGKGRKSMGAGGVNKGREGRGQRCPRLGWRGVAVALFFQDSRVCTGGLGDLLIHFCVIWGLGKDPHRGAQSWAPETVLGLKSSSVPSYLGNPGQVTNFLGLTFHGVLVSV